MSKLTICKACGWNGDDGRFKPHVWRTSRLVDKNWEDSYNDGISNYDNYSVVCENCGHATKAYATTPEEAIETWQKQN